MGMLLQLFFPFQNAPACLMLFMPMQCVPILITTFRETVLHIMCALKHTIHTGFVEFTSKLLINKWVGLIFWEVFPLAVLKEAYNWSSFKECFYNPKKTVIKTVFL